MSTRARRRQDGYDLQNSIGYLLNRAASLVAARFDDDLKEHGVSLQAWRILAALSQAEPQSLSELANHTGAELSYLSRSVAQLEQQGLVERRPSPLDKRTTHLTITGEGRSLIRELVPYARAVQREILRDVPAEDLVTTRRTLRAVCHNLVPLQNAAVAVNRKLTIARRVQQRALAQGERVPRRRIT